MANNSPHTVKGGLLQGTVKGSSSQVCDLQTNLKHLSPGCEIISSISAPGAAVVYTIVYPKLNGQQIIQSFTDTADYRGHSLHIFNVPYLPPVGAKHGTPLTVAHVTVSATLLPNHAPLNDVKFRFTVIR